MTLKPFSNSVNLPDPLSAVLQAINDGFEAGEYTQEEALRAFDLLKGEFEAAPDELTFVDRCVVWLDTLTIHQEISRAVLSR